MQLNRTALASSAGLGALTLVAGLGVVTAQAAPAPKTTKKTVTVYQPDSVSATVYFANRSPELRRKPLKKLARLASKVPADARSVRGTAIGTVQQGGSHGLSVDRAKNVRAAVQDDLKTREVASKWKVKGKGVDGPTKKSRKATVTVRFAKPVQVEVDVDVPVDTVTTTAWATATDTATERFTETATATVTATTTETATATATVTATATATTTATVTTTPTYAPLNLSAPPFVQEYMGAGVNAFYFDSDGEWVGGPFEPSSLTRTIQSGGYGYIEATDNWGCTNWVDRPEWGHTYYADAWEIPECVRGKVTATNDAGETVAYSNYIQWVV